MALCTETRARPRVSTTRVSAPPWGEKRTSPGQANPTSGGCWAWEARAGREARVRSAKASTHPAHGRGRITRALSQSGGVGQRFPGRANLSAREPGRMVEESKEREVNSC